MALGSNSNKLARPIRNSNVTQPICVTIQEEHCAPRTKSDKWLTETQCRSERTGIVYSSREDDGQCFWLVLLNGNSRQLHFHVADQWLGHGLTDNVFYLMYNVGVCRRVLRPSWSIFNAGRVAHRDSVFEAW